MGIFHFCFCAMDRKKAILSPCDREFRIVEFHQDEIEKSSSSFNGEGDFCCTLAMGAPQFLILP